MLSSKGPLVSVLMCGYNVEPFVYDSLRSVLEQSYASLEVVFIDDGSTDGTARAVGSFADGRLRYFARPHEGRGAARAFGVTVCRGDYVAIADADDISLPYRIEAQVAYLRAHPGTGVVSGQMLHFDERHAPHRVVHYPTSDGKVMRMFTRGSMGCSHAAAMMVRSAVIEVGNYNSAFRASEDLDLFLRLKRRYRLANLDVDLVHYRNSGMHVSLSAWFEVCAFQEYAVYCERIRGNGRVAAPFRTWREGPGVRLRLYTWHSSRLAKMIGTGYVAVARTAVQKGRERTGAPHDLGVGRRKEGPRGHMR